MTTSLAAVGPLVLFLCGFCMDPSKYDYQHGAKPSFQLAVEILGLAIRSTGAIVMIPFAFARAIVQWPSPPCQRPTRYTSDYPHSWSRQLLVYIFVALPL